MIVIKYGGNALASSGESNWLRLIAKSFLAGKKIILLHGGGPQIDEEMKLHGVERNFIEGYRYTDNATFDVVEMVLAGKVQQQFVRALRSLGVPAVGITGSDGGLFTVGEKLSPSGMALGQVGDVKSVNPKLLQSLLDGGFLPIVSSVSSLDSGLGMNVNADLAAGAIAGAFAADQVIFMTDVIGLMRKYPDEGTKIDEISSGELERLMPSLSEGMIPKVEAVLNALKFGAKSALIIDGRSASPLEAALNGSAIGTLVTHG